MFTVTTVLFRQLPLIIAVYQTLARTHNISKVRRFIDNIKAIMGKCFWSYNYRLITTVQQCENLQLIVASQVDQLWQHVFTHSSPICPHQQTTVAKYPFHRSRGDRQTEDFLAMDTALWTSHCPKSRDQDSRDPRPRLWGSKTETETRGFQDQDSEVSRPRPRLVKTGLEMSRDQDSSLENSSQQLGKFKSYKGTHSEMSVDLACTKCGHLQHGQHYDREL